MMRSWSTVILAGALAAACSKPNPLFLDTWGEVSDSGASLSSTGGSTAPDEPTTSPATSTTEPPPTTGSTSTSDGSTGGVGPTATGTTGAPFVCEADMSGCCEIRIAAEIDNFFTDAVDGAQPEGCSFVDNPPAGYEALPCGKWSFGRTKSMKLFNDYDGLGGESIKGQSDLAVRFPMQDGELVVDGAPIPWEPIQEITLELPVEIDWQVYSDFAFGLWGLTADMAWIEGDGAGVLPCTDANSCFFCRVCGATPDECAQVWALNTDSPVVHFVEMVPGAQGLDPGWLEIANIDRQWLIDAPSGLLLVPSTVSMQGQPLPAMPSGAMTAMARESGVAPTLRLKACMM